MKDAYCYSENIHTIVASLLSHLEDSEDTRDTWVLNLNDQPRPTFGMVFHTGTITRDILHMEVQSFLSSAIKAKGMKPELLVLHYIGEGTQLHIEVIALF